MDKKTSISILEKIISFLSPKYYNKITWVVVASGIALTSTSLIQDLIYYFFNQYLNIKIFNGQNYVAGIILVIIGLAYNIAIHFLELKKTYIINTNNQGKFEDQEHDRKIFESSDKIMTEAKLLEILNIINGDRVESGIMTTFYDYVDFNKLTSNKYLNDEIESKRISFNIALQELNTFFLTHFFLGEGQVKYSRLQPYLRENHHEKYQELRWELTDKMDNVEKLYDIFREAVKMNLKH